MTLPEHRNLALLGRFARHLARSVSDWTETAPVAEIAPRLEAAAREFVGADRELFVFCCQLMRVAMTGGIVSPPIFDVLAVFGRDETMRRVRALIEKYFPPSTAQFTEEEREILRDVRAAIAAGPDW